jgi:hypothetical protein
MKTVSIPVSDDAASRFNSLTEDQKRELSKIVGNWINDPRTIFDVMHEISDYARKQGLTPEILEDLLKDE